ncbi:MAG: hypothetical protein ACT4P3_01850 [Betaproteobacteria bacterium]
MSGRRQDRLALTVHATAVAVVAVLVVYLLLALRSEPQTAPAGDGATSIKRAFDEIVTSLRATVGGQQAPKPVTPASKTAAKPPPNAQIVGTLVPFVEAGRTWRYAVRVEPPVWRDIMLSYQTVQERDGLAVQADFRHAGGASRFRLGRLAAGDPAHGNSRFPGFFLHAAYVEFPLRPGQALAWQWPWREPNQPARPGRIKRYEGKVHGWEMLKVPAGEYNTVRIDAALHYVEDGRVHASVRETLWIAPRVLQTVRIVREGKAPDEAAQRIVAELVEFR